MRNSPRNGDGSEEAPRYAVIVSDLTDEERQMDAIRLPAHFDGKQILLDEPFEIAPDTSLVVTVLPKPEDDDESESWLSFSLRGLQRAYGEDEPEYSLDMLKEVNPDYDPR